MDIKQEKGNPYKIPQHLKLQAKQKKQHEELKKQRNNHSLPSINGTMKQQKVNVIRNQIDQTKNQIITLKARINALKWQKLRNQKKKQKHSNQINFITTVRERLYNDKKQKQDIQQRKQKELQYLKQQATTMRQKMIKQRQMAKYMINQQKQTAAEQERQKKKQDQQNIRRLKSIELAQNQLKAKNIKKNQLQIQQKLRSFNESRVSFARNNHYKKIQRSLSKKEQLDRILKSLKKQQQKMMEQCKQSQACMLSTLYQLESLNPEKKRKNSISSRSTVMKYS